MTPGFEVSDNYTSLPAGQRVGICVHVIGQLAAGQPRARGAIQELCNAALSPVRRKPTAMTHFQAEEQLVCCRFFLQNIQVKVNFSRIPI